MKEENTSIIISKGQTMRHRRIHHRQIEPGNATRERRSIAVCGSEMGSLAITNAGMATEEELWGRAPEKRKKFRRCKNAFSFYFLYFSLVLTPRTRLNFVFKSVHLASPLYPTYFWSFIFPSQRRVLSFHGWHTHVPPLCLPSPAPLQCSTIE